MIRHINHSLLGGPQACQNTLDPIRFAILQQFFFHFACTSYDLHSLYLSLKVHNMFLKYKYLVS